MRTCTVELGDILQLAEDIHDIVKWMESEYCRRINTNSLEIMSIIEDLISGPGPNPTEEECVDIMNEIDDLNNAIIEDAETCHPDVLPLAEQIQALCARWIE